MDAVLPQRKGLEGRVSVLCAARRKEWSGAEPRKARSGARTFGSKRRMRPEKVLQNGGFYGKLAGRNIA
jgi:hypothetical protein